MKCIVIGAGVAGVTAASSLAQLGITVVLLEKESHTLNKVAHHHTLFPDFREASTLCSSLNESLNHPLIETIFNAEVTQICKNSGVWTVTTGENTYTADALLVTTGYDYFDASIKEELGYNIYKGVHTSWELEEMFINGNFANLTGDAPSVVAFLQCVGSRDQKIGNHYCSKVCCIKAVKQAIEVRKASPNTEVFVFYMDLRMAGQGYEELYREAQEVYHVKFIRGRISEVATTYDGKVNIKAEDTLIGLPVKMTADMLVLMVGMEPSQGTRMIANTLNSSDPYGFISSSDAMASDQKMNEAGCFVAGACKRPMNIIDTIADAKAAVMEVHSFLTQK